MKVSTLLEGWWLVQCKATLLLYCCSSKVYRQLLTKAQNLHSWQEDSVESAST